MFHSVKAGFILKFSRLMALLREAPRTLLVKEVRSTMSKLKKSDGAATSRRDEVNTALRIQLAAARCFKKLGLRNTTVEEILQEGKVSRSTFYRHFASIDAVILEVVMTSAVEEFAKGIAKLDKKSPISTRLAQLLTHMILGADKQPWAGVFFDDKNVLILARLFLQSKTAGVHQLSKSFEPLLLEAREAGLTRPGMKLTEVAEWLMRSIWLLTTVPRPGGWKREDLMAYVLAYVVPSVIADQPTPPSDNIFSLEQQQKLDQLLSLASDIQQERDSTIK